MQDSFDTQGVTPFAEVVGGVDALRSVINDEYGTEPDFQLIKQYGNGFLQGNFPNLTYIKRCRFEHSEVTPEAGKAVPEGIPLVAKVDEAGGLAETEPEPEPEPAPARPHDTAAGCWGRVPRWHPSERLHRQPVTQTIVFNARIFVFNARIFSFLY